MSHISVTHTKSDLGCIFFVLPACFFCVKMQAILYSHISHMCVKISYWWWNISLHRRDACFMHSVADLMQRRRQSQKLKSR